MDISEQYHALYTLRKWAQAQAGKRANMENLPPYKFPRKQPENLAAASFNRQTAGIEKGPVQHLRESMDSSTSQSLSD